jgi:hypothetical protein
MQKLASVKHSVWPMWQPVALSVGMQCTGGVSTRSAAGTHRQRCQAHYLSMLLLLLLALLLPGQGGVQEASVALPP